MTIKIENPRICHPGEGQDPDLFMKLITQNKLRELVFDNYQKIANDFAVTRKKPLAPVLLKLLDRIPGGSSVLDAGCGSGRLANYFQGKNINYVGIDQSSNLIGLAKKDFPRFNWQVADLSNLDFLPSNHFDYILNIAVLHQIPSCQLRVQVLKNLADKLRPGGQLIISTWRLYGQLKYLKLIIKFSILKIFGFQRMDFGDILFNWKNSQGQGFSQRYYHAFTLRDFKKTARSSGLNIMEIFSDKFNHYLVLRKD